MDLNWKKPDKPGQLVFAAGGIALVGLAMLAFATTRLLGIGFLIGAVIVIISSLLLDRFINRSD